MRPLPNRRALRALLPCLAVLSGCASYGLHRPASVLEAGRHEVAVTLDLVRFVSQVAGEGRAPDVLHGFLLLPTLHYRRGVGTGVELDFSVFPVGVRTGARVRLLGRPGDTWLASADAGITVGAGLAGPEWSTTWKPLLLPDAAITAGVRPVEGAEIYAALRYLWLRELIAGRSFEHTPGFALGYAHEAGGFVSSVEGSILVSPSTGDLILAPGLGVGLRR